MPEDARPKSHFWRKPTTCKFWTPLLRRLRKRKDSASKDLSAPLIGSSSDEAQPTTSAKSEQKEFKLQVKSETDIKNNDSRLILEHDHKNEQAPSRQGSLEEIQEVKLNEIIYDKLDEPSIKLSIPQTKVERKIDIVPRGRQFFQVSTILPLAGIACLSAVLMMPMPDFTRGVVTTFLGLMTLDTLLRQISYFYAPWQPEHRRFKIPDYSNMPFLEIPAGETDRTVRCYTGWMNEIDSYDPDNYHVSMTKPVFVQLEGTTLRLSTTTAHIPKRGLWNERPIKYKSLTFNDHRIYDLEGCSVDLLPVDLHKKRFFRRKYPIQLTISVNEVYQDEQSDDIGDAFDLAELVEGPTANDFNENEQWQSGTERLSKGEQQASPLQSAEVEPENYFEAKIETEPEPKNETESEPKLEPEMSKEPAKSGGDIHLLLFARVDREKEDWYRRFVAASTGAIHEQNFRLANAKLVQAADLQMMALKLDRLFNDSNMQPTKDASNANSKGDDSESTPLNSVSIATEHSEPNVREKDVQFTIPERPSGSSMMTEVDEESEMNDAISHATDETYEGLIMNSNIARNPVDYVHFMASFQRACNQQTIPVLKSVHKKRRKDQRKIRRAKNQENELWKGIDMSLFLGPSGSVVWFNVFLGRILFSCLHNEHVKEKVKQIMQKKMNNLKLPKFMENVIVTEVNLGEQPPLIHRVSQPMLDERGTWIDADMTYDGYCYITITTRLDFRRLRKSTGLGDSNSATDGGTAAAADEQNQADEANELKMETEQSQSLNSFRDELDSNRSSESLAGVESISTVTEADLESTGSSTESEEDQKTETAPVRKRKLSKTYLRRLKQKLKPSHVLQQATEISYVQQLMEKMNADILLRVDLHGMVARAVINLPPPPSDRIWLGFRGPPRLWLSAKPTVSGKLVNMSVVTNIIEGKLCDQINRALVYPNMLDVIIPLLGQPKYE